MSELEPIRVLISSGRKDEATRQLARVLSTDPEDIQAWLLMAGIIDDPARKTDCYRQALKLDPQNSAALEYLKEAPLPPAPPASDAQQTPDLFTPQVDSPAEPINTPQVSEPIAGQAPPPEKRSVEDYLTTGAEARALGRESVPAYLREIQAVPSQPLTAGPSRGSLLDSIDRSQPSAPPAPPPIPPGSYRDETPPPPPPWYKKPAARIILTVLILAFFGAAIFGGAKFMQASTPPTATLQPSLTVEILPTKTPQDTWTPLPSLTPQPTLTPIPNTGSLRIALLQVNDLSIWLAGASSPLTGGANLPILLAPGGELVIFTRVGDLWSVGVAEKKETLLMSVEAINALQSVEGVDPRVPMLLGWLPQSRTLLFNTAFNPVDGGALRPVDDLNAYDLASGKVTRLLNDGQGGNFFASPDGRLIAISRPGSISLVDASGENLREIFAFDPILTPDASPYYPKLVWTPDSAAVLLVLPPRDAANDTAAATTVWRIPVDGSEPQKLTDVNTNGGPLLISPDQTRILYQLNIQAETGAGELHATLIDGSGDTILQNGNASRLVGWSSNSRDYTFRTDADNAILVGTLGQTGTTPLSTSPLLYDPTFAPEWVNSSQYLLQVADGLHLGFVGSNTDLIAKGAPGTVFYNFTLKPAAAQ